MRRVLLPVCMRPEDSSFHSIHGPRGERIDAGLTLRHWFMEVAPGCRVEVLAGHGLQLTGSPSWSLYVPFGHRMHQIPAV